MATRLVLPSPRNTLPVYNVQAYGAAADCLTVTDGAITNGSAVLTSASALFTSAHVGKTIVVAGAISGGLSLTTTIASRQSASQVTLTAGATATVTGASVAWGTDNTTAFQAAIDAAAALATGGIVFVPAGRFLCATGSGDGNQTYVLNHKSNVEILGAGRSISVIRGGVNSGNLLYARSKTGVRVRNLTLDATGAGNADPLKYLSHTGGPMNDIVLENVEATGAGYGFQLMGCTDFQLVNCYSHDTAFAPGGTTAGFGYSIVENFGVSFTETGTARGQLVNCIAENCPGGGFRVQGTTTGGSSYATRVQLVNCHAVGCGKTGGATGAGFLIGVQGEHFALTNCLADGCYMGFDVQDSRNITLTGCTARYSQYQGFRSFGSSDNGYVNCVSVDNNWADGGAPQFSMQNDAGGVGSLRNRLIGCRAGLTAWRKVTDAVVTSGSPTITSATASFTSADVGLAIKITGAATQHGTIAAITDGTTATMSFNSAADGVGQTLRIGTGIDTFGYQCQDAASGNNLVASCDFFSPTIAAGSVVVSPKTATLPDIIRGCTGYNPVGPLASQPAVPATTVAYTNTNAVDCSVVITANVGGTTAVAIGGTAAATLAASAVGTVRVPAGQTITLTYTAAPTWVWFGD